VEELAKKKDVSMAQIAVAWSLANEYVTAPIVGTTSLENLKELIGEPGARVVHLVVVADEVSWGTYQVD
jgi:aryl-alcohol dehydrogenase-like predicted oxidoreductase